MNEFFKPCTKCGGSGEYVSRRGNSGTCFACRGYGRSFKNAASKRSYYAAKKLATKTYLAENGKWLVGVAFYYAATRNPIARSILNWAKRGKAPTEKMLVAVYKGTVRTLIKLAAPPEILVPVVEGKGISVEGEVISVKERETRYGWTTKMLVKDERGFKVWGTVPKSVREEVERGSRVTFIANVKVSEDDESFGFFSRPRKAELLAA